MYYHAVFYENLKQKLPKNKVTSVAQYYFPLYDNIINYRMDGNKKKYGRFFIY